MHFHPLKSWLNSNKWIYLYLNLGELVLSANFKGKDFIDTFTTSLSWFNVNLCFLLPCVKLTAQKDLKKVPLESSIICTTSTWFKWRHNLRLSTIFPIVYQFYVCVGDSVGPREDEHAGGDVDEPDGCLWAAWFPDNTAHRYIVSKESVKTIVKSILIFCFASLTQFKIVQEV